MLTNKIALISGGGDGIGKEIARTFVKNGAEVVIIARRLDLLKNTAMEIQAEANTNNKIRYFQCDIAIPNEIDELIVWFKEKYNSLDILVNNASILGVKKAIIDYPKDIWDKVMNININGMFYLTKAFLPLLKKGNNVSIINVSSSVGREGRAGWGAYSVSKFGVEGLSQILAQELKEYNIRVNSVNPGGTRTEMRKSAYPDEDPLSLPHPSEIAELFVYLSADNSKITGQALNYRDWEKNKMTYINIDEKL